jgi:hypothetical protein
MSALVKQKRRVAVERGQAHQFNELSANNVLHHARCLFERIDDFSKHIKLGLRDMSGCPG